MTCVWESLVSLIFIGVIGVYSQDPCQGVRCRQGEECRLEPMPCFAPPCPTRPVCVPYRLPISDCRYGKPVLTSRHDVMVCATNTDCPSHTTCNTEVMDTSATCCWTPNATNRQQNQNPIAATNRQQNQNPIAATNRQQNQDPCATRFCRRGQVCRLQQVYCFAAPCLPIPVCVDRDNVQTSNTCPVGSPVLNTRHQEIRCRNDGQCPDSTMCSRGVCCWRTSERPHTSIVQESRDPCATHFCRRGQVCRLQQVYCFAAPCLPIPVCVDRDNVQTSNTCPVGSPVLSTRHQEIRCRNDGQCPDSTMCSRGVCCWRTTNVQNNGPVQNPDPCATKICQRNEVCRVETAPCLVAPCPTVARCVSRSQNNGIRENADPCATKICHRGQVCRVETAPCLVAPCPTFAKCVNDPSNENPGRTSRSSQYPCATVNYCRRGEVCRIHEVRCIRAPCPPIASCYSSSSVSSLSVCPIGHAVLSMRGAELSCRRDYDCPDNTGCENRVCCWKSNSQPSGPTQLIPVAKPGTCPSSRGRVGICVERCSSDSSCGGNQKCCSNGCGHVCMNPITESVFTPPVRPPVRPVSKPGTCPRTQGFRGICAELCSSDASCTGTQKCCSNGCGHLCMNPITATSQHPGYCPRDVTLPASYCDWLVPQCQDDSSCVFGMKCCYSNTCRRKGCMVALHNRFF